MILYLSTYLIAHLSCDLYRQDPHFLKECGNSDQLTFSDTSSEITFRNPLESLDFFSNWCYIWKEVCSKCLGMHGRGSPSMQILGKLSISPPSSISFQTLVNNIDCRRNNHKPSALKPNHPTLRFYD